MKRKTIPNQPLPGITLELSWLKGFKMKTPYSKWLVAAICLYICAAALNKAAEALTAMQPLLR